MKIALQLNQSGAGIMTGHLDLPDELFEREPLPDPDTMREKQMEYHRTNADGFASSPVYARLMLTACALQGVLATETPESSFGSPEEAARAAARYADAALATLDGPRPDVNAALVEALRECRMRLSIVEGNIGAELLRGIDRWEGVPEKLRESIAKADAAFKAAGFES